ncbi:hypothetical protein PRCB_24450 [Pantoea rodasii]|uniref:Uncharacterized protein n=1 Tax=Pantoea rodasii TaxID=1076549 RepID=A0A2M9W5R2_9GAMM|nr:hypothetical protein [Pantoea rodasii]ORM61614.1 hypothetical protein HA45_20320 [Pantoea rodasii]PJZ02881.1 hypothetical protein PRCB_24450 [Pantoea rodasii]
MNATRLSWKTLRLLSWREGNLMVSRAIMRLKGLLCDDAEHALLMAALVVTDDDVEGVPLSVYSTEVLAAIDLIARDISESAWLSALQWSCEHHAQIRKDDRQAADRAGLQDARAIARYAASHDGGYGDVCIDRCEAAITHNDFESCFF